MSQPQGPPQRRYQRLDTDEEIENLEDYEPGGYHPVDLFDILDSRFEVVYKLGFGGIAMVWLCYEFDAERWRAVKINAASHSSENCSELKMLQTMKENSVTPEQLDAMHIVVPLETFWIDGPNGRHLCSVMPVLGPRLSKWREDLALDYDTVGKMCYQFTEGLGFLHEMGIAHGDFRPANILTKLKPQSLDSISVDEMKELLDAPEYEEVITLDGEPSIHAPEDVVTGVRWHRLRHLVSDDIAIVDFGESYRPGDPPSSLGIPRQYAAPEVVFGGTPTIMSDIWSLAYTLLEFRLGTSLMTTIPAIVWHMEGFAGPIPHEYRSAAIEIVGKVTGKHLLSHIEDSPTSKDQSLGPITENLKTLNDMKKGLAKGTDYSDLLEITLGGKYWVTVSQPTEKDGLWCPGDTGLHRLPSHDVILFADLLRGMFKYHPEDRRGVSEALNHPWFRRNREDPDKLTRIRSSYLPSISLVGLCLLLPWLVWTLVKISPHQSMSSNGPDICILTRYILV